MIINDSLSKMINLTVKKILTRPCIKCGNPVLLPLEFGSLCFTCHEEVVMQLIRGDIPKPRWKFNCRLEEKTE